MALQSNFFRGDPLLEAAAERDSAHITPGARGPHVGKIQKALIDLDGAQIVPDNAYGPATAAAVLRYKQKRSIINLSYQIQADNIVGKLTMASLDREMLARENVTPPGPPGPPLPPGPPAPGPHLNLSFSMTDPSIYVTIEGSISNLKYPSRKAIYPGSFLTPGKMLWIDLPEVKGRAVRLKVEKKGSIFWLLAFVPEKTITVYMMYVFFHPTPVQVFPDKPGGPPVAHVIADDKTYDAYGADWKDLGERYLHIIGSQLGAARKIPLIVPLMRNAAASNPTATNDVFADNPEETLFEILRVLADKVILPPSEAPVLPLDMQGVSLGTASFSSGIAYHANLFNRIKKLHVYLEALDLDSTYIKIAHRDISQLPGGPTVKRHTQIDGRPSTPNAVNFPPSRWDGKAPNAPSGVSRIPTPPTTGHVHHLITDYTFYGAMTTSLLSPYSP